MFIVRKTDYSNYTNDEVLIDFHVHDGPYPKKHKHGFYEIMVVLKGNCANMVNENEFRMSAMDASIQRPDDIHQILHCDTDSYTHINIEITAQLFEQMTNVVNTEFFTKVLCLRPFDHDQYERYKHNGKDRTLGCPEFQQAVQSPVRRDARAIQKIIFK